MFKDPLVILKKELRRIFTDKRMVIMLMIVPLVMLPLMYSIMAKVSKSRSEEIASHVHDIYVYEGRQNDSRVINKFMNDLENLNAKINPISDNKIEPIKELLREHEVQLLINFPDNIQKSIEQFKPFDINIFFNSTSDYSEHAYRKVKDLFNQINREIISERIKEENLKTDILIPFTINETVSREEVNLAKKGSQIGKIIGIMLPFFILIYLFANSMQVGLDTVAGEKERGTLASLLVNQVDRLSIVVGKLISVMIAAFVGAASSVLGLIIASRFFISMFGGSKAEMSGYIMQTKSILQFALVIIPLAMLLVSIVLLVSTYAKNPKEGQGMIMPIYIVVMIIGISTLRMGDVPPTWMRITPIFNSLIALKGIFMQDITWGNILLTIVTNILLGAIIIYLIMKMFKNEKILFRI